MLPLLLPAATVTAAATGLVSSKSSQGEAILRPFLVAVAASLYSIVIASLYNPAFVLYLAIVSVRARESVSKAYLLFSSSLREAAPSEERPPPPVAAGGRPDI